MMFLPSFVKHFAKKIKRQMSGNECFSMCNCDTLEKMFMNFIIVKDRKAYIQETRPFIQSDCKKAMFITEICRKFPQYLLFCWISLNISIPMARII